MSAADDLEAFIAKAKEPPPPGAPIARGLHWHFAVCFWANTPERKAALNARCARKRGGNAHTRRKYRRKAARRDARFSEAAIGALFEPVTHSWPDSAPYPVQIPWDAPSDVQARRSLLADAFSTAMDFPPGVKIGFGDE